jgi:putative FmdB family regulatory protein
MARFDLVCRDCDHAFEMLTRVAIRDSQKRCPGCGSTNVRQTLASYLRNGALLDPDCGGVRPSSGFG